MKKAGLLRFARDPLRGALSKEHTPSVIFFICRNLSEASFFGLHQIKNSRFRGNALCDPDRIQTCNLLIRSQMLYSVKLRDLLRVQI